MDLDQTDFAALYAGDDRAWSRFVLKARPVLEAAVQRTFYRQGLTPDAGLFQDAVADTLERLAARDFALLLVTAISMNFQVANASVSQSLAP